MKEDYYKNSKDYINRWVISYADLVTLLLALFLVMFAANKNTNLNIASSQIKTNLTTSKMIQPNKNLEKTLLETFNNSNIPLLKDDRGYIIRLPESIVFNTGECNLNQSSYKTLDTIGRILSKIENPVIIEGHTDNVPIKSEKFASNRELSVMRAAKVVDYLINNNKINPKRISAVGYGEYSPIAENTSNSGRTKNRRVDIIILDKYTGE